MKKLHLLKKETSVMAVCITTNGIYHDCNLYYDDVPRIILRLLFPSHFLLCPIRSQSAKQGTLSMKLFSGGSADGRFFYNLFDVIWKLVILKNISAISFIF